MHINFLKDLINFIFHKYRSYINKFFKFKKK
jgi:hypothetical protein